MFRPNASSICNVTLHFNSSLSISKKQKFKRTYHHTSNKLYFYHYVTLLIQNTDGRLTFPNHD